MDMNELERVRTQAVGLSVGQEMLELFSAGREEELYLPGREGDIHVFAYWPKEERELYPVFINLHGGGFVKGHREQDVVFCRNLCQNAGAVIFDVDYHTAPEKKYPYALHEVYDAIRYLWDHAEEMRLDRRFVAGGHSAGGNLALGAAILAGRDGGFELSGIICDYPPVDLFKDPGKKRYANRPDVRPPLKDQRMYMDWYIDPERRKESTASPVYASDEELSKLPPTLIITAEVDVLGEEAEFFAFRLIEAGVTVTARQVKGADHGFVVRRRPGFEEAERLIFGFLRETWREDDPRA